MFGWPQEVIYQCPDSGKLLRQEIAPPGCFARPAMTGPQAGTAVNGMRPGNEAGGPLNRALRKKRHVMVPEKCRSALPGRRPEILSVLQPQSQKFTAPDTVHVQGTHVEAGVIMGMIPDPVTSDQVMGTSNNLAFLRYRVDIFTSRGIR